jgi:hypothetical protein
VAPALLALDLSSALVIARTSALLRRKARRLPLTTDEKQRTPVQEAKEHFVQCVAIRFLKDPC